MKFQFDKAKDTAFLTLIVLSIALNIHKVKAQTFGLSLSAGGILSQIDGDGATGYNRLGAHLGLRSIISSGNRLQYKAGFFYNERGSLSEFINPQASPVNINVELVEIPIEVHWRDWQQDDGQYRISYFFGFSYGRVLNASILHPMAPVDLAQNINRNDVSYILGAEVGIWNQLKIGGRFTRSITLLYNSRNFPSVNFRSMQTYFLSLYLVYDLL